MGRSDCQQKRQQWCWKSVGPDSGGVVLDSSAELSIFTPETTLEAIDSDPRLQTYVDLSILGGGRKPTRLHRLNHTQNQPPIA